MLIEETYFGWDQFSHADGCTSPMWEAAARREQGAHPLSHRPELQHGCPNPHCDHATLFTRVTVRLICRGCDAVHLVSGEDATQQQTTTRAYGYGQAPCELAGLYLYPGRSFLYGEGPGRSGWDDQPIAWLVTAAPVTGQLQREDCVGRISRWTNAAHQTQWRADAVQTPLPGRLTAAEHGMAFARRASDLTSIDEAAAYIAATLTHNTLEVHV
ncbi:hypothetical protein [Streptomyces tauricus]